MSKHGQQPQLIVKIRPGSCMCILSRPQVAIVALQVIWVDVGSLAWLNTDSSQFYIDMTLRSRDLRFDGKHPRIRVRPLLPLAGCMCDPAGPPCSALLWGMAQTGPLLLLSCSYGACMCILPGF